MQRPKSIKSLIRMELLHKIGVVGLGYVGLPLAIAFSKKFNVIGFDISDKERITELNTVLILLKKLILMISKIITILNSHLITNP